jgi:ribonucleoside-triphosphate reductase|uniref:Anaerobic ribonucleoside triphosphate reductase n=1 Tax=Myoviridae sp. ctqfO1 TaxID=2827710 RepID=A0A8S5T245_9CAUD|nr:MAG TPA: anaerobic ribonucleoside triphosphate reductase [Myoviridae sp. ctqfO1]
MKVEKRDGRIVAFDKNKISVAILKAMRAGNVYSEKIANNIADEIENELIESDKELVTIQEIETLVFSKLISHKQKLTAKSYEGYRSIREFQRSKNTVDEELKDLIGDKSEYWKEENSNKNSLLVSTKRDYIAGVVSKDIAERYIFSPDVIQAHNDGVIHIHDMDYSCQRIHNCELINLDDMLQNGTVINGVRIDKPHRLLTATTIATQIILAVTSMSYGGASVCLGHLSPFVRDSRKLYYKKYIENGLSEEQANKFADIDIKKEVSDSVQTFNYQLNSMTNVNG